MNILVYDIAAENGGAVSILESFYKTHLEDQNNHYYYFLSLYHVPETHNITPLYFPEVKKSWLHRLLFDLFVVQKYIKQLKIDSVISLQNVAIPFFHGHQTVYEHNALPFSEYKFSFIEDRKMWVYQNIIGKIYLWSIRKADKIIVQVDWMKDELVKSVPNSSIKIEVQFPDVIIPKEYHYKKRENPVFFFPANSSKYKNHRVIVEACKLLHEKGITNYRVVFTLNGNETDYIKCLYKDALKLNLNIEWVGQIPKDEMYKWYSKTILVFPSYIETIGLPLFEAKTIGCPIIAADCKYARNVVGSYPEGYYFEYDNAQELAAIMSSFFN